MKQLGDILQRIFRDPKLERYFVEGAVNGIWTQAVGEKIAGIARPISFENGVLHVRVSSAAWRNELTMLHDEILQKLNERLGRQTIARIVFR